MQIRDVRIEFDEPTSFMEEYERSLSSGWVFVPTELELAVGEVIEVTVDLKFCGRSARALGVVTSRIVPALARMLDRVAGVVVEFADGVAALQEMIQDTLETLVEMSWSRSDESVSARRHERFRVSMSGEVERQGDRVQARTLNLSASGALLEVAGLDCEVGDTIELHLVHPTTREPLSVKAKVVRQDAPESKPAPAVAVQFVESSPARTGRKAQFMDQLRAVTHGPHAGGMSGNLEGLSLPALLQSVAVSSARGTMDIIGERAEAHILFQSGQLRHASLGRIEGVKALARLMEWTHGEFSFQPMIEDGEPDETPVPFDQAIMEAVHQSEELRRLRDRLLPETVVVERCGDPGRVSHSKLDNSLLDLLEQPACPSALLDALPYSDAEIWGALLALIECELVRVRD